MNHTAMNLFWIGLGGAVGSAGRFACTLGVQRIFSGWLFPIGTLAVNVLGSLAIGFLSVRFEAGLVPAHYRLAVLVGLLGGFTTFSTFSLETLRLLEERQVVRAGVNVLASVGMCLLACWIGQRIARGLMS